MLGRSRWDRAREEDEGECVVEMGVGDEVAPENPSLSSNPLDWGGSRTHVRKEKT